MLLRISLIFLLNISVAYASNAQNGVIPNGFREGYYSFGAEATYISTSANYTDRGTSLDIESPYAFSTIQTLAYGRYDFTDQTSMFFELPLNYATSENPIDEYSSFKAAGLAVGVNYDFKFYSVTVIPQFKGYLALEKFDRTSEEILTSDGANYIDIGSHVFKNFSALQFHGYLSYQYRMDGFSGLLNYQADVAYKLESASMTLGLKGFQTVIDDENKDNPSYRHNYLQVVNGNSLLYGSVDPSRLDIFTQLKMTLSESIDIYGAVAKSLRGENSGDILTFTIGLEYFFQPLGGGSRNNYNLPKEDNFSPDDEAIDPKIEEEIRNYNKPKPKLKPKKTPKRVRPPKSSRSNDLVVSEKEFGKKTTSTSPFIAEPKSKKPKRVNIDFQE